MGLRRTPLFDRHREKRARMVPFAGWEMPVQYTSIIEEHKTVRKKAGLFDVSHMGELSITGEKSADFLDELTCNHVADMQIGQVRYNAVLNDAGGVIDDVTVYRLARAEFMVVSNASNYERVFERLRERRISGIDIENRSDSIHLLALQGPLAQEILSPLLDIDLNGIKYYHFDQIRALDDELIVSRTGYTGEDGFEIYSSPDSGTLLWDRLLERGEKAGLLPVGLGARDTLRLEAFYPLYGHELSDELTPVESGIGWIVKEKKIPYPGYQRIMEHKKTGVHRRIRPVIMGENGIPREGYRVLDGDRGEPIGEIRSGGFSPVLECGIASGLLNAEFGAPGTELRIEIRNRLLKATVNAGPFVRGGAGAVK